MDGLEDMALCASVPAGGFLATDALRDLLKPVQTVLTQSQRPSTVPARSARQRPTVPPEIILPIPTLVEHLAGALGEQARAKPRCSSAPQNG